MLTVEKRQAVEKRICRKLIEDCIAAGYSLTVDDGEEEVLQRSAEVEKILAAMFSVDDEYLYVYQGAVKIGWVRLVYGNDGWDVISDYTTNLEDLGLMAGADAVSDAAADEC